MFESVTTDPQNLIPGALLHGRLDKPDGTPVYGRLDPNGGVYLYTDCTSHGYGLATLVTAAMQGHAAIGAAGPYHYTGLAEIVTWAQGRARETHRQDADCAAFLDDGTCVACGVAHAEDPEPCCGARAFHRPGCNANEHSEAGRHRAAVRSHDAAQRWLDEANRLRGWGDGTERKVHQPSPGPFGGPLAGARRRAY